MKKRKKRKVKLSRKEVKKWLAIGKYLKKYRQDRWWKDPNWKE